jgi:hypothetical protein
MELLFNILGHGFTIILTFGVVYVVVMLLTTGLDTLTKHDD